MQKHFKNVKLLMDRIAKCLSDLAFQKRALMQYQEINASLSEELQYEGCTQLANDKSKLSKLEELLLKRLDSLFYSGPPYRSFSASWVEIEKIFQSTESNNIFLPSNSENKLDNVNENDDDDDIVMTENPIQLNENNSPKSSDDGYSTTEDVSDDEIAHRTKELMKTTQEKLYTFESTRWSMSKNNEQSPTPPDGWSRSSPSSPILQRLVKFILLC